MRILIAEDSPNFRDMLGHILTRNGYEVVKTSDGTEALSAMLSADAPRIAVLDWMMPKMDGLEVVRRLRSAETDRHAYIIILTAKDDKSDVVEGLGAGANDYLSKPIDKGELLARVAVGRRMIELENALIESREALTLQATCDFLTGILNRRAIFDQLNREIARLARNGGMLAVGMCDVDHFKSINDTYGHLSGDDVLCGVSKLLSEGLRKYDSIGRIGGEEFLIVAHMKEDAPPIAAFERLRRLVAQTPVRTRAGAISVTISIGVTLFSPGDTVDQLMAIADAALYKAKSLGRNRVVFSERKGSILFTDAD